MITAVQQVDQNSTRQGGTGLRVLDHYRLFPGYTLFTSLIRQGEVYLIDLKGQVVHQWSLPYPPASSGYLLPNGNLLYNGKLSEYPVRVPASALLKGGVVVEVDRYGKVVWEYHHPDLHQDACRLRNGNTLVLCLEKIPRSLVSQIQGGIPGTELDGEMYADVIHEVTPDGKIVWSWHAYEHLNPETDIISPQAPRQEWTHGNSVRELSDGNLILSFRNISTVVIVDRTTGNMIWKLGREVLAHPSFSQELFNGNILIVDNSTYSDYTSVNYSRVIEVNRQNQSIVWDYVDSPPHNSLSSYVSGAQRLPNGNTLITESAWGRLFEVTPEGDVVWDYVPPHFGRRSISNPVATVTQVEQNPIFCAFRYTREEIPWL